MSFDSSVSIVYNVPFSRDTARHALVELRAAVEAVVGRRQVE